jgi:hypothetical protein
MPKNSRISLAFGVLSRDSRFRAALEAPVTRIAQFVSHFINFSVPVLGRLAFVRYRLGLRIRTSIFTLLDLARSDGDNSEAIKPVSRESA